MLEILEANTQKLNMELIIVESPTKAKTLGRFLGDAYSVEATAGHIKDLPKSKLGIDVENNFLPDFPDIPKKKDVIKKLKSEGKKAKVIYLATDPDREGEAIAQHVAEVLNADSKIKRIAFHEITKEAVTEAITNPRKIDKNLVDAQIARRVLDRLVGYKLSPLLWKKVRRGLSAGRVQSVAVRLIVEKEREIKAFKSDEYWQIFSKVRGGKKEEFDIELVKIGGKPSSVKNKAEADKILKDLGDASYNVSEVRKKEVSKSPYPPFTTSTMTQAAARVFGWSSKKTMSMAQKLYEEGLITYHRTDSFNLSKGAVDNVRKFIAKEYGENYLPTSPKIYKTNSKVAQEAHEAIRPTNINADVHVADDKWGHDEETLYKLIWSRFVACQMNPSIYDETTIDVEASPRYLLRVGGQIMRFDGWRKVIPAKLDMESGIKLPDVSKGEELTFIKTWGDQKYTQPPARYNEASLIKMLEKLGIGRPSTYAPTISTIQIRNYVEKDQGKFAPTTIGEAVTDFLVKNFPDVFEYAFTAGMEDGLDKVANGDNKWTKLIKDFYKPLESKIKSVDKKAERVKIETEKIGKKCPDCADGELVIRIGRFGKFVSCSRFPDCKHTEKYLEKIGVKCPECNAGDVIIKKTSKGRNFFGCSRYPDCKYASWRSPKKEDKNDNEKDTEI